MLSLPSHSVCNAPFYLKLKLHGREGRALTELSQARNIYRTSTDLPAVQTNWAKHATAVFQTIKDWYSLPLGTRNNTTLPNFRSTTFNDNCSL